MQPNNPLWVELKQKSSPKEYEQLVSAFQHIKENENKAKDEYVLMEKFQQSSAHHATRFHMYQDSVIHLQHEFDKHIKIIRERKNE